MRNTRIFRTIMPWACIAAAAIIPACGSDEPIEPTPPPPPTIEPDIDPDPVSASFTVTIDPQNPAFVNHTTLEPIADPITEEGDSSKIALHAFVKPLPARPGILWVELYFENKSAVSLRDVEVELGALSGTDTLYDFTNDPFAEPSAERSLNVGRIGPEGMGRLVIGVPDTGAPVSVSLSIAGVTTIRKASSSAPLALTPDGKEAWIAWPDADVVAVVDTASDTRVAQVAVPGGPSSVAITPDGKLVVVASAKGNKVSVIDREKRTVTQSFGENEGIGREPRHIVVSPDGGRAFVSAYVGDSITSLVRNDDHYRVEATVPVGRRPTGMAIAPDSQTLLVSHFLPRGTVVENEGWVSVVSTEPLEVAREIHIDDPFNISSAKCLADVFGVSASRMTTEAAPSQLAGVFMNAAGTDAWTPGTRIGGAAVVWERGPNSAQLSTLASIRTGELAAPFIYLFDTREPKQSEMMLLPGVLDPPDVNMDYVKCVKLGLELELISRDIIPSAPDQQVNRAAAFPNATTGLSETGIAHFVGFTRGDRRALVLSHMSDEIAVTDAITYHPTTQTHFALSGSNPSGLVVTPDGKKAYVAYENSTFVSVLDMSAYADPAALPGPSYIPYEYRDVPDFPSAPGALTGKRLVRHIASTAQQPTIQETKQVPIVDADPIEAPLRRGRTLFFSSNPDKHPYLTATRLGACATCHPGGGNDGSLWATMEGERRTLSLFGGIAGRGWLHASATHADAEEFVGTIVQERLGGNLAQADVKAMAEFLAHGIPKLQSPKVDDALAAKGKSLFAEKCAGCHAGEKMTSGNPDPANPWGGGAASGPLLFDVGTATDDAHVMLGTFFESLLPPLDRQLYQELRGDRDLGANDFAQQTLDFRPRPERKRAEFKAPSLVNVWDNAIFFHDGRFDKLEEPVHYFNEQLKLGMSAEDEKALIEYLKTL